jgi:hypothetical protein
MLLRERFGASEDTYALAKEYAIHPSTYIRSFTIGEANNDFGVQIPNV